MKLTVDISYNAPKASHSINRKYQGIIKPGRYQGFLVELAGGLSVSLSPESGESVAVVATPDGNFTVRGTESEVLTIPTNSTSYVVLTVNYVYKKGAETTAVPEVVTTLTEDMLVLAKFVVPNAASELTDDMMTRYPKADFGVGNRSVEVIKADDALGSGLYVAEADSGTIDSNDYHLLHLSRSEGAEGAQIQIKDIDSSLASVIAIRHRDSEGQWSDHVKLWHDRNMGAGSGLDAGLLNGLQSTDFARYIAEGTKSNSLANQAWIANYASAENVDHIWYDDAENAYHFVADKTFKQSGNASLIAGSSTLSGDLNIGGEATFSGPIKVSGTSKLEDDAELTGKLIINNSGSIAASTYTNGFIQLNGDLGTLAIDDNEISASSDLHFNSPSSIYFNTQSGATLKAHTAGADVNGNLNVSGAIKLSAQSTDSASISTTISDSATYFDFNLADDPNNDFWRWRFSSAGTTFNAMTLKAESSTTALLSVPGTVAATRIAAGWDANIDNSISCSNWFRSSGNTGWYNDEYGGGIYMKDTTWIRTYGGKKYYVSNTESDAIKTAGGLTVQGSATIGKDSTINGNIIFHKGNTAELPAATSSSAGIVQLDSSVDNSDTSKAATPGAVKAAYDLANSKLAADGKAVNASKLDGYSQTTGSTANTIVRRNNYGDINARLFRSEYDSTNASINFIMTQVDTVSNNYLRPSTPEQFRTAVTDSFYAKKSHDHTASDLPTGSTSAKGILQLNDSTTSTSTALAATANAVKKAYALAESKADPTHSHDAGDLPNASTSAKGVVQLSTSRTSTSSTLAATASAVKAANDNANNRIASSQKGAANGVATLGSDKKIPMAQIPWPSNAVINWYGPVNNIPSGWALCDGTNGTPDLRDRFVIGAGGALENGTKGGSVLKTTNSAGSHGHIVRVSNTTLTTAQMPSHGHSMGGSWSGSGNGGNISTRVNSNRTNYTHNTGGSEGHGHGAEAESDGAHAHTISDARPPFYALCYIMYIG